MSKVIRMRNNQASRWFWWHAMWWWRVVMQHRRHQTVIEGGDERIPGGSCCYGFETVLSAQPECVCEALGLPVVPWAFSLILQRLLLFLLRVDCLPLPSGTVVVTSESFLLYPLFCFNYSGHLVWNLFLKTVFRLSASSVIWQSTLLLLIGFRNWAPFSMGLCVWLSNWVLRFRPNTTAQENTA